MSLRYLSVKILSVFLVFTLFLSGSRVYADNVKKEDKPKKKIALTFDDGPCRKNDGEILSILSEYGIKATFFMIGENIEYDREGAKRIAESGHEIGNHTYSHSKMKKLSGSELEAELDKTADMIYEISGSYPSLFRPPEGYTNDIVTGTAGEKGYTLVLWTIDTLDWQGTCASSISGNILKNAKDGAIILCHDYIYKKSHTAEAMRIFIPELLKAGYEFVTVSELLGV